MPVFINSAFRLNRIVEGVNMSLFSWVLTGIFSLNCWHFGPDDSQVNFSVLFSSISGFQPLDGSRIPVLRQSKHCPVFPKLFLVENNFSQSSFCTPGVWLQDPIWTLRSKDAEVTRHPLVCLLIAPNKCVVVTLNWWASFPRSYYMFNTDAFLFLNSFDPLNLDAEPMDTEGWL